MIRIGVIGSRRRNEKSDRQKVFDKIKGLYCTGDWLISGGCPKGGDHFAEQMAKDMGMPILIFHANWKKFGRGAGFVRNSDIAAISTVLIACVAEDRKGGTENTIIKFLANKKLTEVEAIHGGLLHLV